MSPAKKTTKKPLTTTRRWQFIGLVAVALILAYISVSRAIDTGSWWEYGYGFVLLLFALNRFLVALSGLGRRK